MIGKVHNLDGKILFACCDKELIDKKINYNDIEIHFSKSFFGSSSFTKSAFIEQIRDCDQANIFGNRSCDILLKENLVSKDQIIYFDNVAHIQIYKL